MSTHCWKILTPDMTGIGSGCPKAGICTLMSGTGFQCSWLRHPRLLVVGISLLEGEAMALKVLGLVWAGAVWLVGGACPEANNLGDSKIVLASTNIFLIE